uniref:Uncharacterized protein n=1 Tax=Kalanchoe fedtschenkoi TaxID=63787 RepID=A0A7N0T2R1_KALFE
MGASLEHLLLSFSSDSESSSPTSVLPTRNLQTILSPGREQHVIRSHGECNWRDSKSVREQLEDEELKGFMDLGFVFTEEDQKDPNLVSILPGLRRLPRNNAQGADERLLNDDAVQAERRHVMEKNKKKKEEGIWKQRLLIDREMGAENNELLAKEQIKLWAQSVASAVR